MESNYNQNGFNEILKSFLKTYSTNPDVPTSEWITQEMQNQLPETPREELNAQAEELIDTIDTAEKSKKSLEEHIASGGKREKWFHESLKSGLSFMSAKDTENYLQNIDDVINDANKSFAEAMHNQNGDINKNKNLNGNIAEHYHKDTYNINAAAQGKTGNAKVRGSFSKNSVDVTIDQHHYQLKYGKTAKDTIRIIKRGNYRGQILVVPKEQVEEVQKAFPDRIIKAAIGDEKLHSNELTKEQAKQMQEDVQNGNLDSVYDWDSIRCKDLTYGIAKKIEKAGIMGAASGFGLEVFRQIKSDEDPDVSKAVKEGLKSGADQGLKAAAAAAIKVAAEKGCLKKYTKGVSSETCSNIAFIGIENAKTLIKLGEGKISTTEAQDQIATTTIAAVTGICLAKKFKKVGEKIGEKFGEIALKKIPVIGEVISPYAAKVGGLVGGLIGSAAGKYIAEPLYAGVKKAVGFAKDVANNLIGKVKSTGKKVLGHSKAKA